MFFSIEFYAMRLTYERQTNDGAIYQEAQSLKSKDMKHYVTYDYKKATSTWRTYQERRQGEGNGTWNIAFVVVKTVGFFKKKNLIK